MMRALTRLRRAALPVAALAALTAAAAGPPAAAAGNPGCQPVTLPVSLAAGSPAAWQVTGWLCARGNPAGRTVQVLLAGATYGAWYWDFPADPATYSYTRYATAAGYATLAIDRPGTGASSHPPPAQVTLGSEAWALRQVITALRGGATPAGRVRRIILAGHSLGSYVIMQEAADWGGADALILTAALHSTNLAARARLRATFYPAAADPEFARAGLPAGYDTTRPGTRGASFYNLAYARPQVIAEDEALKDTVTTGELATIGDVIGSPQLTRRIRVPVLLVVGQDDSLNCGTPSQGLSCDSPAAILARESAGYSPAACLQALVVPRAGHDINLHPGAPQWFTAAARWTAQLTGAPSGTLPARPCRPAAGASGGKVAAAAPARLASAPGAIPGRRAAAAATGLTR